MTFLTTPAEGSPLSAAFQIYAPSLIYALGLGAVIPALPGAVLGLGGSLALAAFTMTLTGIGSLVANAPAALLASRAGERQTMIISAGVGTGGVLTGWYAVAQPLGKLSDPVGLGLLLVGITLIGAAGAGFNLARQSYLAVAVPVTHRARAMSLLGGMLRVGQFLGPFAGAGMQALIGLQGAFVVAGAAMALAVVVSFFIKELVPPEPEPQFTHTGTLIEIADQPQTLVAMAKAHWRTLLSAGLGVLCLSALRASRTAVIPLWAEHIGLSSAHGSLIYGIAGAADLLMFYPSGMLMDKFGRRVVAVATMTGLAVGTFTVPFTSTTAWLMGAALLIGLGNGFGSGIVMTLGADYSPEVGRPKFLALWRLLSDAGLLTGPTLLSTTTAALGLGASVFAMAGLGLAGAVIFLVTLPGGPGSVGDRRQSAPGPTGSATE